MATPPPTTTAAPAATPVAPAPAAAAAPAVEQRHPAHADLMARLAAEVDGEPETPAAPPVVEPVTAPAAGEKKKGGEKDPKAVEAPAHEEPNTGIRARKPAPPKRPDLPLAQPAGATPPPAATPPVTAAPQQSDAEFEAGLVEGEREMLEQARFAEKNNPSKHKGLGDKVKGFIKEHTKFLDENPDIDERDPKYLAFLDQHRPKLSQADVREIETARVAEAARKPVDERVNQLQHEIFVRDETPKIENFGQETYRTLAQTALPKEILDAVKEKGGLTVEIAEQYAPEIRIANEIFTIVADDLKEFRRFSTKSPTTQRALVEFDEKNPQHLRLAQMVGDLCETFKTTGGAQLQRNGKWFVTRDEWSRLVPERRGEFWTFTNAELEKRALAIVPNTVSEVIKIKHQALDRDGYVRKPRAAAAAPAAEVPPPPPATAAPALRPSAPPPSTGTAAKPSVDARTGSLAGKLLAAE